MKICEVLDSYKDVESQIIRIYDEHGEMFACDYCYRLKFELGPRDYKSLVDKTFKKFEANGIAIHFYC